MQSKKIQKQHKTGHSYKFLEKHLTDPINGKLYKCPIALECGCTYDRYSLSEQLVSDDNLFFKCLTCNKIHSKGVVSNTKPNKQLMSILEVYFPNYREKKNTIQEAFIALTKYKDNKESKNKLEDAVKKLKKFDWIRRLGIITESMSIRNVKYIRYNMNDKTKSIERWANDYTNCTFIKECADNFMLEHGITLTITSVGNTADIVEITCK